LMDRCVEKVDVAGKNKYVFVRCFSAVLFCALPKKQINKKSRRKELCFLMRQDNKYVKAPMKKIAFAIKNPAG
jgi:hypothetical protein